MNDTDLEELAAEADLLAEKLQATSIDTGSAILSHAAATARSVGAGIRRAIDKESRRLARAEAFSEQRARENVQREDPLTKQLAEKRGISYEAMADIRREAAARATVAASAGSISEQLERTSR